MSVRFGPNSVIVEAFITSLQAAGMREHGYGDHRAELESESIWAYHVEPLIANKFAAESDEIDDALALVGQHTEASRRAACALMVRDRIHAFDFEILYEPFANDIRLESLVRKAAA